MVGEVVHFYAAGAPESGTIGKAQLACAQAEAAGDHEVLRQEPATPLPGECGEPRARGPSCQGAESHLLPHRGGLQ